MWPGFFAEGRLTSLIFLITMLRSEIAAIAVHFCKLALLPNSSMVE